MSNAYNPKLNDLISLSDIPESLYFLHDGLSSFLDNINYSRYNFQSNPDRTGFSLLIDVIISEMLAATGMPGNNNRLK